VGRQKKRWKLTKNGVIRIHGDLVLGGVSDETLGFRESHIAGRRAVSLIVGDDLDLAVLENADAGIGCAKIDTDCGCFRHFFSARRIFPVRTKTRGQSTMIKRF